MRSGRTRGEISLNGTTNGERMLFRIDSIAIATMVATMPMSCLDRSGRNNPMGAYGITARRGNSDDTAMTAIRRTETCPGLGNA